MLLLHSGQNNNNQTYNHFSLINTYNKKYTQNYIINKNGLLIVFVQ